MYFPGSGQLTQWDRLWLWTATGICTFPTAINTDEAMFSTLVDSPTMLDDQLSQPSRRVWILDFAMLSTIVEFVE
jgi:hypothetical protein